MTSSRFRYHDLRGLRRSLSLVLPLSISQVHLTSWAVKGLPSCHLTPSRSGRVNSVPSSFQDQLVAKSGTIDAILFCGTSCLNMTRLLNTPIIGLWVAAVASSWIDMLAGLSKWGIFRMPPGFWANAVCPMDNASDSAPAAARTRRSRFIPSYLLFNNAGCNRPPMHRRWPVYWALVRRGNAGSYHISSVREYFQKAAPAALAAPIRAPLRLSDGYSGSRPRLSAPPVPTCRARRPPCASRCRCY